MPISPQFLETLECPHPATIAKAFAEKTNPSPCRTWTWRNEIRPIDLYCYLGARFGPPNGIQNFLRSDDSDNLIHWDWTLVCEYGWIAVWGKNFRTDVHLLGSFPFNDADQSELIKQLKHEFPQYGRQMSEFRAKVLEHWIEFINPYFRFKKAIDQLLKEVEELNLNPDHDSIPDLSDNTIQNEMKEQWSDAGTRYSKGLGMCFGVRSMLPVMVEAFVNLLLFVLMKDEFKKDDRLRENATRQPIDIRIKSLHVNCNGFTRPVDYTHETCREYHTLVNERNDLLHGNVVIAKLQFNDVYFCGRVPVFKEYKSMWERSFGVDIRAVGFDKLEAETHIVDDFIKYVLTCLNPQTRSLIEAAMDTRDLGLNLDTGGIGVLFPSHLVDDWPGPRSEQTSAPP